MVATARRVDLGRPPELSKRQDHRIFEHPSPTQIFKQGRVGIVEVGANLVLVALDRTERGRPVDVPVISLKTVSNMLTVTKRVPRSISRRASKQLCPNRVRP